MINIYDSDYIPKPTYRGSIHLSRFGLFKNWKRKPGYIRAEEEIMIRLGGKNSVFEIAMQLNLPFEDVYGFLEEAVTHGLIEKGETQDKCS